MSEQIGTKAKQILVEKEREREREREREMADMIMTRKICKVDSQVEPYQIQTIINRISKQEKWIEIIDD